MLDVSDICVATVDQQFFLLFLGTLLAYRIRHHTTLNEPAAKVGVVVTLQLIFPEPWLQLTLLATIVRWLLLVKSALQKSDLTFTLIH